MTSELTRKYLEEYADKSFNEALANVAEQAHCLKGIAVLRDWLAGREQTRTRECQDARDSWARLVRRWRAAGGRLEGLECDCGRCWTRTGRLTANLLEPA